MAGKIKVDQIETVAGTGTITLNNDVAMAATKTLPAASLTGTLPANIIDSDNYVDGSIDTAHYAAGSVDATAIGNDVVNSQHYAAASIDNEHLADNAVDTAEIADNAITLAKMASGTDGNVISYDASGNPVAIATGSDGQVLTSTGAGSPPAFETLPTSGISDLSPYFQGRTDGTQVPTNGVTTKITFGGSQDSDSAFASSTFTVPSGEGGKYFLSVSMIFYSNASNRVTDCVIYLYKNGSQISGAYQPCGGQYSGNPGANAISGSIQTIQTLAATDTLEVYGYVTTNSGAVSMGARTFMGFKIGA